MNDVFERFMKKNEALKHVEPECFAYFEEDQNQTYIVYTRTRTFVYEFCAGVLDNMYTCKPGSYMLPDPIKCDQFLYQRVW